VFLDDVTVPTAVATPGMSVADLFCECIDKQVPGIPFRDRAGHLTGKASIRHVLKMNCIPDYMVQHASLLGDSLESLQVPEIKVRQMLKLKVDDFVLPETVHVSRKASVAKALAVMERHDTTYLFVVDGDDYAGCVSIMGIGAAIIASTLQKGA
jgi:hypothetical protein